MIDYQTAREMERRDRRLVAAIKRAVRYLRDCDPMLDGPGEADNPESGVGSLVASLNRAMKRKSNRGAK